MSNSCDGASKTTIQEPGHAEKCSQIGLPNINSCADYFALKTSFRGFEKEPVVVVPRIDIAPYLQNITAAPGETSRLGTTPTTEPDWKLSFGSHFGNCSVKLLKDDLLQLKADIISKAYDMFPYITCRICKKNYPDEKKLRNHQSTKHMIVYQAKQQKRVSFSDHVIVHELKEYHKCRKCTRIFEDYALLKLHMKRDHKKRKCYICYYCKKSFVDRTIFKVHIKLHCDVCGDLMPNKAKYVEHRRNICRVLKLHRCRTCKESFFKFMDLKDHSYEHIITFFVCDVCKDQFETKCAIAHHIAFLHSDRRPVSLYEMRNCGVDRLYLCNFCDVSSVERDVIEQHVGKLPDLTNKAMTGYKDYYFCDQCLKMFDMENDMLQHKWSHFLKTNDKEETEEDESVSKNEKDDEKFGLKGPEAQDEVNIEPRTFNVNERLPLHLQPIVILKRMDLKALQNEKQGEKGAIVNFVDIDNLDGKEYFVREGFILREELTNKPIVDPKSKKTLMSKHRCPHCNSYFSTGYCLRRHIQTQHLDLDNLQCKVCEETFFWPSLLINHRCIRANVPEMPFEDARPEIHFDNLNMELNTPELDDLINDDYPMHCVDFEVPGPAVQLTEYNYNYVLPNRDNSGFVQTNGFNGMMQLNTANSVMNGVNNTANGVQLNAPTSGMMNINGFVDSNILKEDNVIMNNDKAKFPMKNNHVGYKITVQEVPIEF